MSKDEKIKKNIRLKPSLSWSLSDYKMLNIEAPTCLNSNTKEGEAMSIEETREWVREEVECLAVIKEENSSIFEKHYEYFLLNLQYMYSLGKIEKEDYTFLTKNKDIFDFGK